MVSKAYLLDKRAPPSAAKTFFNQHAIPVLIDTVGAVELTMERIAVAGRAAPLRMLAVSVGLGCLLRAAVVTARRR